MKNFTLVLVLAFMSTFTFAQTFNFYQEGDTIKQDTVNSSVDFTGQVQNLTNKDIASTWLVTNINFPNAQWNFYVCDGNICYQPGDPSRTQTVTANSTALLKTTIVSGGVGSGTLTIRAADDATGETQEFLLKLETLFTSSSSDLAEVAVFSQNAPNPFDSYTRVKYDLKGNNGQIIITDMTGRQVSVHNLNDNAGQVEIGQELETGIYFYTLTVDGQPIVTKRLQKL